MKNKEHMNMTPHGLTVLNLAATLTLSACGGGGGGGGGAPLPPKLKLSNFQPAAVVIGQADFAGTGPNKGADYETPAADSLATPYGNPAVSPSGTLFISDTENYRVLGYQSLPTVNNAAADFVLGQPDFTSNEPGMLSSPQGVSIAGGRMAVANFDGDRVLIYNTIPAGGGTEPDVVVGQVDFDSQEDTCDTTHLNSPEAATLTADGRLVVADSAHNRVLIWNTLPTAHGQPADLVLGQGDFTHCVPNDGDQDRSRNPRSARTLHNPTGVWTDGHRLAVIDNNNNRVLVWNSFPTNHFQPADIVLGQEDFTSASDSADTLDTPYGIDSNGRQLAVADSANNRVLIWDSFPTSNFQQPDIILGQSDFAHTQANDDNQDGEEDPTASARVLRFPTGVRFYQDKLLVSEIGNNRVLVFQSQ